MIHAEAFRKALGLTELAPPGCPEWDIKNTDLHRPGLQFAGYYEYFAFERPQVLGRSEMTYLESLEPDVRAERLRTYFSYPIPCVIVCRGMKPVEELVTLARENDVALYTTQMVTTKFTLAANSYINRCLAPRETRHGVLVDVYGVGVLITGESGVGKSEAALELVKRGHQLVADDVVDICRVSDSRLVGEAPESIRHFMEIRGIGIINIRAMFGIGSVLMTKSIDMNIHLEKWREQKDYDRLGLHDQFTDIMDVRIQRLTIPVKPGRNLAIIIEVAARNFRLKRMGYSAAQELDRRFTASVNAAQNAQHAADDVDDLPAEEDFSTEE